MGLSPARQGRYLLLALRVGKFFPGLALDDDLGKIWEVWSA